MALYHALYAQGSLKFACNSYINRAYSIINNKDILLIMHHVYVQKLLCVSKEPHTSGKWAYSDVQIPCSSCHVCLMFCTKSPCTKQEWLSVLYLINFTPIVQVFALFILALFFLLLFSIVRGQKIQVSATESMIDSILLILFIMSYFRLNHVFRKIIMKRGQFIFLVQVYDLDRSTGAYCYAPQVQPNRVSTHGFQIMNTTFHVPETLSYY